MGTAYAYETWHTHTTNAIVMAQSAIGSGCAYHEAQKITLTMRNGRKLRDRRDVPRYNWLGDAQLQAVDVARARWAGSGSAHMAGVPAMPLSVCASMR